MTAFPTLSTEDDPTLGDPMARQVLSHLSLVYLSHLSLHRCEHSGL